MAEHRRRVLDVGLHEVDVDTRRTARLRAPASADGEKSSPVTWAPRRASEMVSVPMWH
jgi:hypothetical protein